MKFTLSCIFMGRTPLRLLDRFPHGILGAAHGVLDFSGGFVSLAFCLQFRIACQLARLSLIEPLACLAVPLIRSLSIVIRWKGGLYSPIIFLSCVTFSMHPASSPALARSPASFITSLGCAASDEPLAPITSF